MRLSVQLKRERSMWLNYLLRCTANVFIVAVLPARMGSSGEPLWIFLAYAVTAGTVLALAEDVGWAREIFVRPDIRNYLKVRIAIVVVCGIAPFLSGSAFTS